MATSMGRKKLGITCPAAKKAEECQAAKQALTEAIYKYEQAVEVLRKALLRAEEAVEDDPALLDRAEAYVRGAYMQ